MQNDVKKKGSDWWVYILVVALAVAFTCFLVFEYHSAFDGYLFPVATASAAVTATASDVAVRADWGVMGDFFGGMLNPAFSFLGLILLLLTLRENKKALALSQEELTLSREELKRSNEALQSQASTLDKQRFEDTFFSMLDQLNNALDKVHSERIIRRVNGVPISSIGNVKDNLNEVFNQIDRGDYLVGEEDVTNKIILTLKGCVLKEQEISRLFRVLYQILKFIANNQPDSSLKDRFDSIGRLDVPVSMSEKMYSNMIRALLPTEMYLYLAVNCLCADDGDDYFKYKCLIERYALLEHMQVFEDIGIVYCPDHMKFILEHYTPSAFGKSAEYEAYLASGA